TPPPTHPTLFPYTTLFRSSRLGGHQHGQGVRHRRDGVRRHLEQRRVPGAATHGERRRRQEVVPLLRPLRLPLRLERPRPARRLRDRKSTRLNSSHVAISYA